VSTRRLPIGVAIMASGLWGCLASEPPPKGPERVTAEAAVEAVAQTILAHRFVYTSHVVASQVPALSPDAGTGGSAPPAPKLLPAELLRYSGEHLSKTWGGARVSFALISDYAINKVNRPRSEFEKLGLKALEGGAARHQGVQTVGSRRYFSAMYPDRAVAKACVDCHNAHPESPRQDFRLQDLMGGLIVSIALDD
jgi:hypothetical protein